MNNFQKLVCSKIEGVEIGLSDDVISVENLDTYIKIFALFNAENTLLHLLITLCYCKKMICTM